ncbi:MAG: hypothetical protein ACHREM_21030 [Polyangiales bacterium]
MQRRKALRRRYGRSHTSLQPGDAVAFRRSSGQLAFGTIVMFQGDRVKVSFCETQLEKWLPIANVSKSTLDQVM